MAGFFKLVIYTPRRELFGYLLQNLVLPDLEMFYVRNLDEVESYYNRVKPNAVILYVDHHPEQLRETLSVIDKLRDNNNCWLMLLTSDKLISQKFQTALPVKQVFLQKESDDFQQVAHNLMFIRSLSMAQDEQSNKIRFSQSINDFLKIIYQEKSVNSSMDRLINLLPKQINTDNWAMFYLDKFSQQVDYFTQFVPPTRRSKVAKAPNINSLAGRLLGMNRTVMITEEDDAELFEELKELNWAVKQVYFIPIQYREQFIGGLLLGNESPRQMDAKEIHFLGEVMDALGKRVLDTHVTRSDEAELSNFAGQLLNNHFDEEAIFQYTCRKLTEMTKANSAIFWQHNKGFGFIFPKFVHFTERTQNTENHDKDMVFFDKETYLSNLVSRGKMEALYNIDTESRLSNNTQQIFRKLQYRHILLIPIKVNNEVIGAIIINKKRPTDRFSVLQIHQSEEIVEKTQQVLKDAQTVKEANRQVKQFSRIFDLGRDAKLGLTLFNLLSRLNSNLRKALGWNDVAIFLLNETGKHLNVINRIGFDSKINYGFDLQSGVSFPEFQALLANSEKISNSYFLSKHKSNPPVSSGQKYRTMEWESGDLVVIPLDTRQDVLGYLLVADPVDRLKPAHEKITPLEYYANQAAVSVENSMLYEELRNSQERYRSLSETMSLGLVTCNTEQKIVYLNPAFEQLLGYKENKLSQRNIIDFFAPTSKTSLREMISLLVETVNKDHVETRELEIISKTGETIPVNVYGFPFYERRKHTGFFLILNDLRIIKRLERMKADFNSMIVHDLRSPMNVIQGFVELIRNKIVGEVNQEQEELLDIVKDNVKKVLALVDNFLVASKLEVGKFNVDLKQGEINSLIQQQIDNHRVLMKNKQIEVKAELDPNLPLLMFDPLRIEQVLNNLLSNALKFTPDKGKIIIKSSMYKTTTDGKEKMYVCIAVKDNGVGIPKNKLPYVFEKYEQVEDNQSFNIRGTGLGLSICKEIIQLHLGEIWVESTPNDGSTFYFSLPIVQAHSEMM
ncbi:MAG: PAS domain S-box protein [Calditrichaeota bacterium]|nr:PAS domain S-box protein [Calditrichota bacterium]MCB9069296.1 PAS domain S-box protein [Calditrichia bacterium]